MRAYWRILRATDRAGTGASRKITPADLRMIAGQPATAGDLAHVWLMTHPVQKNKFGIVSRKKMLQEATGASDDAIDFWVK